jgi:hypothetical protein
MPIRKRVALIAIPAAVIFTLNCSTLGNLFAVPTATPTLTPAPTATNTPSPTPRYVPAEEDLIGSRWKIVVNEPSGVHMEYYLIFHENGVLETTHPNDKTYNNDTWALEGNEIVIRFNDGYAVYRGTFSDRDTMAGTATNKVGESWEWTASRRE